MKIEYDFVYLNKYINAERTNRYVAAKIKKDAGNALYYMLLNKPKIETPARLHMHWIIPSRRNDLDNVSFSAKYLLDSMVKANIIPNDNCMHIIELRHTFEVGKVKGVIVEPY